MVPFLICCALYTLLSLFAPMEEMDTEITSMLHAEFSLRWYCLIPAALMIVLPFCGVNVKWAMGVSLLSSLPISLFLQHNSFTDCLRVMVMGYTAKEPALREMLSGGGIVSMLDMENSVIVVAALVPWCIASSVPIGMIGADLRSIPVAFYLWLIPLWWAIRADAGKSREDAAKS